MTDSTKTKLFGELISNFGINAENHDKLLSILDKYEIISTEKSILLSDLINNFINIKISDNCSDTTIKNYKSSLNIFYNFIHDIFINQITLEHIRNYKIYLLNQKLAKSSIHQHMSILKIFFNYLKDNNIISTNIINLLPKDKNYYSFREALNNSEINTIKNNCKNDRDYALINFLSSTGCRLSEITNLKLNNIDFNDNKAIVTGKGNKTRIIYFDKNTSTILQNYINKNKNTEYLFEPIHAHNKLSNSAIQKIIHTLGKKSNLSHPLYPHLFRHTFATNLINKGMPLYSVQTLLGHSNPKTTEKYAHLNYNKIKTEYNSIMNWVLNL